MATTCIMSIHINKGKTARQSIAARLDYIMNPKKTDGRILISAYACSPETAADEFMLFRQEYQTNTGRTQENEVIGYHVRQAFKPEEITPEVANEIGNELASRMTDDQFAYVVATHIDKHHIHNHIILCSTDLEGQHKYRDVKQSAKDLAQISDSLCREHELSVIQNPQDAKGLISQLSGLDDLIVKAHIGLYRLRFRALEGQILAGHIAVLAVRSGHLIPAGCGFVEHDDLTAFLVLSKNLVIRARTGAQVQRPTSGRNLIDLHIVGAGLVLLSHQINTRSHGGRHRRSQDAALRKPRPFAALVNVMHQRQFPFAVQRFGHGAAHGRDRAKAVARKVGAVGGIYTNQGKSSPSGHTKSAQPVGGR